VLVLSGFVLVLMNANKLNQLSQANFEKQKNLELLEAEIRENKQAQQEKATLQEQLYQAQKLEAVGRLAGGIAHDFNNILAAMNGYAEFLIDDLDKETQQHKFAQNILRAGNQARDLVDKVLAFSRRDNEEMQIVDLKNPLEQAIVMVEASLPKTIELKSDLHDSAIFIHGNVTSLTQAMMNLCVNSKDAIENEKGTLTISLNKPTIQKISELGFLKSSRKRQNFDSDLPLVEIEVVKPDHVHLTMGHLDEDQEYACLSVADDGCGMTREVMEHIFEPFFTTKDVSKGTGLGMAMVHKVVATHKAAMSINSVVGGGTQFDILFPIAQNVPKNYTSEQPDASVYELSGRILIVDDQSNVADMMQSMVERFGFEAEMCDSAHAALEILEEHSEYFNVVITDHNMPKMTGLELVQEAAELYPDMPFIVATGYALEKMEHMLNEHTSVKAVIKKPVDRVKLKEALQKTIIETKFLA